MSRCSPTRIAALLTSIFSPAVLVPGVAASTLRLVLPGSEWRYLDDGSDQGAAWRAALFDDSAWSQGPVAAAYGARFLKLKKSAVFFAKGQLAVYELISQKKANYPVSLMCRVLGICRSGYYERLAAEIDCPLKRSRITFPFSEV